MFFFRRSQFSRNAQLYRANERCHRWSGTRCYVHLYYRKYGQLPRNLKAIKMNSLIFFMLFGIDWMGKGGHKVHPWNRSSCDHTRWQGAAYLQCREHLYAQDQECKSPRHWIILVSNQHRWHDLSGSRKQSQNINGFIGFCFFRPLDWKWWIRKHVSTKCRALIKN